MKNTRSIARILSILWAIVWIYLCLTFAIGQPGLDTSGIIIVTAVSALFLLGPAVIAWWWETLGGVILLIEGLLGLVLAGGAVILPLMLRKSFPVIHFAFILFVLALPPLISGILFLIIHRQEKKPIIPETMAGRKINN